MRYKIYLQDLKEDCFYKIWDLLRKELSDEIEEAVNSGLDRGTAENEIIDHHLNTHNFGWHIEL